MFPWSWRYTTRVRCLRANATVARWAVRYARSEGITVELVAALDRADEPSGARPLRRLATLSESLVVACPRGRPAKWTKVEAVIVAAVLSLSKRSHHADRAGATTNSIE
jgi:hypothetical protein